MVLIADLNLMSQVRKIHLSRGFDTLFHFECFIAELLQLEPKFGGGTQNIGVVAV